jgi:HEAT repeat protein
MGSPRAVPALLGALDDKRRAVRAAAARSLGRIGSEDAIEPLITAGVERRIPRDVVSLALFDIGTPAVPRLLELTRDDEPLVRAASVELVGYLGNAGDSGPLPAMLRDTSAGRAGRRRRLARQARRVHRARCARRRARRPRAVGARRRITRARSDRRAAARSTGSCASRRRTSTSRRRRALGGCTNRPGARRHAAGQPDAGPYLREAADLVEL